MDIFGLVMISRDPDRPANGEYDNDMLCSLAANEIVPSHCWKRVSDESNARESLPAAWNLFDEARLIGIFDSAGTIDRMSCGPSAEIVMALRKARYRDSMTYTMRASAIAATCETLCRK